MSGKIGAFFDMDRTLVRCNSGTEWIRFQRERGKISLLGTLRALGWLAQYKLAILDMEALATNALVDIAGDLESEMIDTCLRFTESRVLPHVAEAGRKAIAQHVADGHIPVLLTSSSPYVSEPVARHLGIAHTLCTRLGVENGRFSGKHVAPACYGTGKVYWAERFAAEHDIDLAKSFFYTDSYSDMPMLERVGEKRVINPDTRLSREARRRGWPVEHW